MILNQVELLLGVDLGDLAPDVHVTEHFVDFADLLFHFGEEGGAFKAAGDGGVPVPAVLPEDVFVLVEDQFVVGGSLGDQKYEFLEKDVIFVCFLEI